MARKASVLIAVLFVGQAAHADEPVGSVVAWMKSFENVPALPDGWVECNGQVLDDPASPFDGQTIPGLNGTGDVPRFLRGGATSGTTGGTEDHSHGLIVHPFGQYPLSGEGSDADPTTVESTLPSYYEVVWIMKVKSSIGVVPAVSEWGLAAMALLVLGAATITFKRLRVA